MRMRNLIWASLISGAILPAPQQPTRTPVQTEVSEDAQCYEDSCHTTQERGVDPEAFFEDAPEELDYEAQPSSWQLYMTHLAHKLYVFELIDLSAAAYTWLSRKMRAALGRIWWRSRRADKDARHVNA